MLGPRRHHGAVAGAAVTTATCRRSQLPWAAGLSLVKNSFMMVRTKDTVDLDRPLPNSQLVLNPDIGHGRVFQFHEDFLKRALEFL